MGSVYIRSTPWSHWGGGLKGGPIGRSTRVCRLMGNADTLPDQGVCACVENMGEPTVCTQQKEERRTLKSPRRVWCYSTWVGRQGRVAPTVWCWLGCWPRTFCWVGVVSTLNIPLGDEVARGRRAAGRVHSAPTDEAIFGEAVATKHQRLPKRREDPNYLKKERRNWTIWWLRL
jgi:hypothetical protein